MPRINRPRRNADTSGNYIPLPPGKGEIYEIVGQHTKDIAHQEKILNWTFAFIVAILVVCVIAFITFFIDAWRFHYEAYREYNKTIENLNNKAVQIKESQINQELQSLRKEVNSIKQGQPVPILGQ